MTRLILWRHGRTAWNIAGRVQGQTDIPLDEVGEEQVVPAAARLVSLKPSLLVSSDLRRASQTAAALADLTGLSVELDARLRERDFGPWQGLTRDEIQERFPAEFAHWMAGEAIDDHRIETLDEMMKRVGAALHDVADRVGDATAVLALHGGAAKAGCAALLGWPASIAETLGGLGNCRYSELRFSPRHGWQLRAHNV